ncbi:hypothetical protein [Streptomyces sp. NBC_00118]|uniref:hypothetical protein n=1 Tax=Streptomyces sp. NBC_00118 TaxID=2975658 RepID=UPI003089CAC8|nr:hypothetical protein OG518_36200 [Streptomyces sp. NBC_01397]
MDAGDLATWVGSGFGAGAFGAAAWTLASQRKQLSEQQQFIAEQLRFMAEQSQNLSLERDELKAVATERRRRQAEGVRMHVLREYTTVRDPARGSGRNRRILRTPNGFTVTVTNASAEPVHVVSVRFGPHGCQHARMLGRDGAYVTNAPPLGVPVALIGVGEQFSFSSESGIAHQGARPLLLFTDNDGVPWQRDATGDLREVLPPT